MSRYKKLAFPLFFLILLLLTSCDQYYLSICQNWVDVNYLASTRVNTPDPRKEHPPTGQMLILSWRVPKEILKQNPHIELDIIYWDYTTRHIEIPIKKQMDYTTYKLFDEEYQRTEGILTFKAAIITQDNQIFREWKHQLWVNLITL